MLSRENLSVSLDCSGNALTTIPTDLATNVCAPNQEKSEVSSSCTVSGSDLHGKEVTLQQLLRATREIQWMKKTDTRLAKSPTTTAQWSLELEAADLPRSAISFFVGCKNTKATRNGGNTEVSVCKVPVNVEARASSVGGNNAVTCAYGKESNPQPLQVEMSTEKNTETIDCGTDGSLHPATSTAEYCVADSTNLESCTTKAFVDIFPTFVTSWWTTEAKGISAKLTTPAKDFPEAEQQFRPGCVPKQSAPSPDTNGLERLGDGDSAEQTGATTSSCNVIVTLKTSNSTSLASSTAQMAAVAGGAAALTGFLVGSFC
ncbi:srs domain-containing protein [Neospora caninum Liverpool]|uniref:Srs domain-containing protein n=1 Tax=Neospora caninum (strain Liverpool) TaxID=572307 RepID=F0VA50_NEOCL|nr:srs domain-containing protein [Neospora caninum Liverpool]CBZ50539.1 srs domain-containing protein [Neospora caninum Liverpool]CEL65149.1 TPA: SRS domain-containing protein [Neospora caninum Liverpool]|eukprot:XP_003880572.1 srs domain-containing protein [Neospora caninum Liverpool]